MPQSETSYCVVGITWADSPDKTEFLAVEGKLVVFDTLAIAQETLPRLFGGRQHAWSADRETLVGIEMTREGFNRLAIWKSYDPYDVPNGFRSKGIWSEGQSRAWKHHVMWHTVIKALVAWADDLEAKRLMQQQQQQESFLIARA